MDEQGDGNQNTCRYVQIHAYIDCKYSNTDFQYMILTCQYPIDTGMY